MSEKVLGFYKKDGRKQYPSDGLIRQGVRSNTIVGYLIEKQKLVSVRLASESVDLKALKDICKNIEIDFDNDKYNQFSYPRTLEEVIERAEKEAKKK